MDSSAYTSDLAGQASQPVLSTYQVAGGSGYGDAWRRDPVALSGNSYRSSSALSAQPTARLLSQVPVVPRFDVVSFPVSSSQTASSEAGATGSLAATPSAVPMASELPADGKPNGAVLANASLGLERVAVPTLKLPDTSPPLPTHRSQASRGPLPQRMRSSSPVLSEHVDEQDGAPGSMAVPFCAAAAVPVLAGGNVTTPPVSPHAGGPSASTILSSKLSHAVAHGQTLAHVQSLWRLFRVHPWLLDATLRRRRSQRPQ